MNVDRFWNGRMQIVTLYGTRSVAANCKSLYRVEMAVDSLSYARDLLCVEWENCLVSYPVLDPCCRFVVPHMVDSVSMHNLLKRTVTRSDKWVCRCFKGHWDWVLLNIIIFILIVTILRFFYWVFYTIKIEVVQNMNLIDSLVTEIRIFKFILICKFQNVPCALGFEVKHSNFFCIIFEDMYNNFNCGFHDKLFWSEYTF